MRGYVSKRLSHALLWLAIALPASANNQDLVLAARQQVGVTLIYDGSYRVLDYPGGDLPLERGVCTDVIVRALRTARALDLQKLVHEDMAAHFGAYQGRWGMKQPDANIDHRRVPNLMVYFQRAGYSQPVTQHGSDYLPGDVVAWNLGGRILHVGIVSDRQAVSGVPLIIHNIGAGAREEDILFRFIVIGHYRLNSPRDLHAITH